MRCLLFLGLCLLLSGCDDRGIRTGLIGGPLGLRDAGVSYTPADMRVIVDRQRPGGRSIICTEPLPDVATALAKTVAVTAKGGNGTANGSVEGSYAAAAAAMELAGRSTALLGLRDGLYRACEAYANGIIGDNSYALLLSRYGQLMVTLFLGQDLATADARTTWTVNQAAPPATPPAASQSATSQPAGAAKANAAAARRGSAIASPRVIPIGWFPAAAVAHPSSARSAPGKPTSTVGAAMTTPAAIATLQANYLGLDQISNDVLFVACVANADRTRADPQRNDFLEPICNTLQRYYAQTLLGSTATRASR